MNRDHHAANDLDFDPLFTAVKRYATPLALVSIVFTLLVIGWAFSVNGHPNFPSYGHANLPTPVGQLTVSGTSIRIRPALSLSLSRYEFPRILSVIA